MARVIKGVGRTIPGVVVEASERAQSIVEEATTRAEAIVGQANKQANLITDEAKRQGAQSGRAQAAALLQQAHQAKADALSEAENTVVSIAISAAKRVVGDIAEQNPGRIKDVVAELLKRAERASRLTVLVNPQDLPLLSGMQTDGQPFNAEGDDRLKRGECIVSTNLGDLDARFDVQLDALERALRGGP